jgi:hypothetical protein
MNARTHQTHEATVDQQPVALTSRDDEKEDRKLAEYRGMFMEKLAADLADCVRKAAIASPTELGQMTNIDRVRWAETVETAVGLGMLPRGASIIDHVLHDYPFAIEHVEIEVEEGVAKTVGYRAVYRMGERIAGDDGGFDFVTFVAGTTPDGVHLLKALVEAANSLVVRDRLPFDRDVLTQMPSYRAIVAQAVQLWKEDFQASQADAKVTATALPYEWKRIDVQASLAAAQSATPTM